MKRTKERVGTALHGRRTAKSYEAQVAKKSLMRPKRRDLEVQGSWEL